MNKRDKIWVTGHTGLAGSAMVRELKRQGYENVLTVNSKECDLRRADHVQYWFSVWEPDFVIHCAAKVGGIMAHTKYPVEFTLDNLKIQNNVFEMAHRYHVRKLLFLASACAYPKLAHVPILENALLTGPLEQSNEGYALAKIVGIRLAASFRREYGDNFISAMPTNLFGLGDNYDLDNSHVLPGMMRRIFEAQHKDVTLWGTGTPWREFLYADDLARACVLLMNEYNAGELINIGGHYVQLRDLADLIQRTVRHTGRIHWDSSKPDGTPDRKLDGSKMLEMGWKPQVSLDEGLKNVFNDFLTCQRR